MTHFSRLTVFAVAAAGSLLVSALANPASGRAASGGPALYTTSQAKAGGTQYSKSCAQCHGAKLEGGAGPPLSGPNMVTLGAKTHLSVGDLFDYMTTNMPMNDPASLKHDQYVNILAYILQRNGYKSGKKALTWKAAHASKVMVTSYNAR